MKYIMRIYSVKDIDVSELEYADPKQNVMGGQSVFVQLPNKDVKEHSIIVQTPKVELPFGLNTYENNGYKSHSIDLSFNRNTTSTENFVNFVKAFDEQNLTYGIDKSYKWFGKRLDKDIIETLYNKQLKQNGNFAPTMRIKMPTKNGEFVGDIFDQNENPINMNVITKGCSVQAIIQCLGIYFVAKEYGVSWKVVQLKVYPTTKLSEYGFIDEDEIDDAEPN